jgi:hypothetical protein
MSKTKINRSRTKSKLNRRITKASTSKTSATKTSAPLADFSQLRTIWRSNHGCKDCTHSRAQR